MSTGEQRWTELDEADGEADLDEPGASFAERWDGGALGRILTAAKDLREGLRVEAPAQRSCAADLIDRHEGRAPHGR